MTIRKWIGRKRARGPVAAVCRSRREAARAAAAMLRAGFDPRKVSIVEKEFPCPAAAAAIAGWKELSPAWVTIGCLNAIGAGLESLGLSEDGVRRCRGALRADRVIVVVQGGAGEAARALRACRTRRGATG